jgi:hypothetical protein
MVSAYYDLYDCDAKIPIRRGVVSRSVKPGHGRGPTYPLAIPRVHRSKQDTVVILNRKCVPFPQFAVDLVQAVV